MNASRHPARGFTLLETLLASALLGALLLALNFFVFSMADIWGQGSERRLFEQHVRAVTRDVEAMLRSAAMPALRDDYVLFVRDIRLPGGRRVSPLTFELPAGHPRLPWDGVPLPDVVCALVVEEARGLVLCWQSRLEEKFDDAAPREWVMTPFVRGIVYDYRDADSGNWRSHDALQRDSGGRWLMPSRLRLKFTHGTMQAETTVGLPAAPGPLPHF